MSEYVLGTGAESDPNEIWEYIAEDNLDAADRWLEKLNVGSKNSSMLSTTLPGIPASGTAEKT